VEASFEDFVLTRGKALLRFAVMLCGDRGRAEDLVQSTLLAAYRWWAQLSTMEHPEAYVRTVLVRAHLRWWRRRSSTEIPMQVREDERPDRKDPAGEQASRDAAWELLGRLPRRQRAVLVLRYYEDLSDNQIAETLGCHPGTVRSQAARALAALRAIVSTTDREALP
jgi:RNA polymerase sigma-70 factor (sigma-E family)